MTSTTNSSSQVTAGAAREPADWKERWKAGGWYLGVPILSAGVFAAVPFWHAQSRLNRPELRSLAVAYTVAGGAIMAVYGITPKDAQGEPVGALGGILQTIAVVASLIVIITSCAKLVRIRREIFDRPSWAVIAAEPQLTPEEQARARRAEAKALMAKDPARAQELGIGRPDLGCGYDDGGLVDINSAPASVLASVCGLDPAIAEEIVVARTLQGGAFYGVGEVLLAVHLPPSAQDELEERAVLGSC